MDRSAAESIGSAEVERASQVELALMGTIRELLREHRELIAKLVTNGSSAVATTDAGSGTQLIAHYRAIRQALALADDKPTTPIT